MDEYCVERRAAAVEHVHIISDKNYNNLTAKKKEQKVRRDIELQAIANDPRKCREYLLKASMLEDRI